MCQEVLECFKCTVKLEYAITQSPRTASITQEWFEHEEQEVLERLMYAQMQYQTWVCQSLKLLGQPQPRKNDIKHQDQEVLERVMYAQNALSNLGMTSHKLQG